MTKVCVLTFFVSNNHLNVYWYIEDSHTCEHFFAVRIQRRDFGEEMLLRHKHEVPYFLTESRKHIWGFATNRASSWRHCGRVTRCFTRLVDWLLGSPIWNFFFSQEDVWAPLFSKLRRFTSAKKILAARVMRKLVCNEDFFAGRIQRGNFGKEILLRHACELPYFFDRM